MTKRKMIDARELFAATLAGRMKGPQFLRLFPVAGMTIDRMYLLVTGRYVATDAECAAIGKVIGATGEEVAEMFRKQAAARARGR